MIVQYIISAVKNFFGLQNDRQARKRPLYSRVDFDVSDDDDDSDLDPVTPKRRRVATAIEVDASGPSYSMADWIKPRKASFSSSYYYSTPLAVNKPVEPTTIVLSDDSADDCEVVSGSDEVPWDWKPLHRSSRQNTSAGARRSDKSSRHTKATHKRCADGLVSYHATEPVNQKGSSGTGNMTEQPMVNGHSHEDEKLSGHCAHVCSVHSKTPLSQRKKRGSTADECYRLEDKERYRLLLQQYSAYGYNGHSVSKAVPRPSYSNILKAVPTPEVQVVKDKSKRRVSGGPAVVKEKLSETHQQYHTRSILLGNRRIDSQHSPQQEAPLPSPEIEILDSVAGAQPTVSERTKSRRKRDSPVSKIDAEQSLKADDSVIITKEVMVPKWKQTLNSLGGFEYSSPAWLQEWKQQLAAEREEKQRLIQAAKKKAETLEKSLETMVNKLHLDATEDIPEIIEEVFDEEEVEPLPELTPEMEERIDDAFCPTPPDELLVEGFRLQIRRRDMETLQDLNWLNDEVINFYMNLLMERGKDDNMPSVYAVNTFFYPKLISGGHDALKRWTRKINIFAHEIMLVPVHLGVHWCLAVINFKDKTLIYYDSMGGNNNECLNALSDYLQAESLDKKKKAFDMTDWSIKNAKDIPQQMNSSDCGMFACKYAEYITRNAKITFKQEHMPYFRRRMVYEIITKRLL